MGEPRTRSLLASPESRPQVRSKPRAEELISTRSRLTMKRKKSIRDSRSMTASRDRKSKEGAQRECTMATESNGKPTQLFISLCLLTATSSLLLTNCQILAPNSSNQQKKIQLNQISQPPQSHQQTSGHHTTSDCRQSRHIDSLVAGPQDANPQHSQVNDMSDDHSFPSPRFLPASRSRSSSRERRQFARLTTDSNSPQLAASSSSQAQQRSGAHEQQAADQQQAQDFSLSQQQQQPNSLGANDQTNPNSNSHLANQTLRPTLGSEANHAASRSVTAPTINDKDQAAEASSSSVVLASPPPPASTTTSASSDSRAAIPAATMNVSPTTLEPLGESLGSLVNATMAEMAPAYQALGESLAGRHVYQQQQQHESSPSLFGGRHSNLDSSSFHSISSLPSSISIITPISRAPVASLSSQGNRELELAQQSSSTMMRPIYVLGQPLGERDYQQEPSAAGEQQQAASKQLDHQNQVEASGANPVRNRSPKITDREPDSIMKPASEAASFHQEQDQQHQPAGEQPAVGPSGEPSSSQQSVAKKSISPKSLDSSQTSSGQPADSMASSQPVIEPQHQQATNLLNSSSPFPSFVTDRMTGPSLVYTDGHLTHTDALSASNQSQGLQPAAPRLFQSQGSLFGNSLSGASVVGNNPRRPSLPPPVNQANAASGFRSPLSPSGPLVGTSSSTGGQQQPQAQPMLSGQSQTQSVAGQSLLQPPINGPAQMPVTTTMGSYYQTSLPPYLGLSNSAPPPPVGSSSNGMRATQAANQPLVYNNNNNGIYNNNNNLARNPYANQASQQQALQQQQLQLQQASSNNQLAGAASIGSASTGSTLAPTGSYSSRRPLNITRVERRLNSQ